MSAFLLRATIAVLLVASATAMVEFRGHKVLRVPMSSPNATHVVQAMKNMRRLGLDFWVLNKLQADIRVPPTSLHEVTSWLSRSNVDYSVMIEDVHTLVSRERQVSELQSNDFFTAYHTYDDINTWLQNIAQLYPSIVTPFILGNSTEGRLIHAVTITGNKTASKRPGIFYNGGQHAREWITVSTVCYIIDQLTSGYDVDPTVTQMLDNVEFTLVPIVNVDGYAYTWTTDRMWRKTRGPTPNPACIGVDPNRNWDDHWCTVGATNDPCDDEYCGPVAFSEPEVKALANYIISLGNVMGYIDFHSYSQLFMSPWGWTTDLPKDYQAQTDFGQKAVNAMQAVNGQQYGEGPIATTIYPASGSSADYTYSHGNIILSYGVELRDTGTYGFVLPPNQIKPQGAEVFAMVKLMAATVSQKWADMQTGSA